MYVFFNICGPQNIKQLHCAIKRQQGRENTNEQAKRRLNVTDTQTKNLQHRNERKRKTDDFR